ncbi:MAG TPA: M56 family metallopeptidase [Rhodanobacter sp.]|nr:M56 family metallopeptidase [Rhodanobacter sp.]
MDRLEAVAMAWAARGWLALLAFTAAVLMVAALRKPCRRWFGAERAFQLWLLPPLALLASQLPHAAAAPAALPPLVYTITSAVGAAASHADGSGRFDWRAMALLSWLVGLAVVLVVAVVAQRRYRRHLCGAVPMIGVLASRPVLRAASADAGPALVGAWRSRIVLPADFRERYDADEQVLVLAHESAHARRGDGWWCLFAQLLAALLWCHPLAWWALAALRHDQELACDAAVLREHGAQRRSYANAMLKTQSAAFALPVGCTWSPRHPLTERIAMLKSLAPSHGCRNAGVVAISLLAVALAGSVYAAVAPVAPGRAAANAAAEYQLDMTVDFSSDSSHLRHAETQAVALCSVPGEVAKVRMPGGNVDTTITNADSGHVRVDMTVSGADGAMLEHTQLLGVPGKAMHVVGSGADGKHGFAIDFTPRVGCPARVAAEASSVKVTEHLKNASIRTAAESVAAKAGWTLINPDVLGRGVATLSFERMPAGTALQRLAGLADVQPVFEGKQVRFEPK